ncbi:MAG: lipopolysaccharide kinase InaA family protein [Opitutae bacterium]|nr:lipopolysaccharide kinase InaA family protein [Opitutae bacterium]
MSLIDTASGSITLRLVEASVGFSATELNLAVSELLRILPERREVYRGVLNGSALVVAKRFLQHPKQGRDWRREWEGLLRLNELGLPAPAPLCVAAEGNGSAVWVIMDCIDGARSLQDAFADGEDETCLEMAQELAKLVDATHRAGARQTDQHIDNWAWDGARLHLLDAASFEYTKHALSERLRLQDLAAICVTLAPPAERLFRAAISNEYLVDDEVLRGRLLYQLDGAIVALQAERTRRYFKKSRRTCSEFVEMKANTHRMLHLRKADPEIVQALVADPEALMAEGERVKSGNTCTVQRVMRGERSYILKRYNQQPLIDRVRKLFTDSRALKSWSSAWVLEMAFIPTARALAVYEDTRQCLPGLRYLLMEQIDGQLLPKYIEACGTDASRIETVADGFVQLWESLGRLRAAHGDLKATNLIVGTDGRLYLFDLDAFRFGLKSAAFERGRQKDLRRFMKNWSNRPELLSVFEAKLREVTQ